MWLYRLLEVGSVDREQRLAISCEPFYVLLARGGRVDLLDGRGGGLEKLLRLHRFLTLP